MKITASTPYVISVPTGQKIRDPGTGELICSAKKSWIFLKLETDAGIVGWGDGGGEWLSGQVVAALEQFEPLLIGSDPLKVEALTADICTRSPWKGGPIIGTAAAAINMALYDITGKAWGVPVHAILGGKRRDKVQVYASGGLIEGSPEEAVAKARKHMEEGYSGVKGNPLESRTWPMDTAAIERSIESISAVREALPDAAILLDTHGSPQPELSIEFARRVAPYSPLFLEEPVKVGSVDALAEVSRRSPVPVATGEKLFTSAEFEPLIRRRACAFLQPDITHCHGITEFKFIAKKAEEQQMLMAPHNVAGPVGTAAAIHASAAISNFLILELGPHYFDRFDLYADHDLSIADGFINVSDRPGLGIDVKEADIAAMEHEPMPYREYRHADGSWKGW